MCVVTVHRGPGGGWRFVLFLMSSVESYYVERLLFEFIVKRGSVCAQCFVCYLYVFYEGGKWEWVGGVEWSGSFGR